MTPILATERERLLVTIAAVGVAAITTMSVSAQCNGINGHAFTASVSSIVGIIGMVGAYLYGKWIGKINNSES